MDEYGPATYGERVADVYDEWYSLPEPDAECALLADLATGGRVLELGIGTGRVALPLAATGVVVFNTFFMLTTQEAQERCFRNVAAHLEPGGRFLVQVFVPNTSRIERGENLTVKSVGVDMVATRRHALRFGGAAGRDHADPYHRIGYSARARAHSIRIPARARSDGSTCRPGAGIALGVVRA